MVGWTQILGVPMADVPLLPNNMVEHPKSKSSKPRCVTIRVTLYLN